MEIRRSHSAKLVRPFIVDSRGASNRRVQSPLLSFKKTASHLLFPQIIIQGKWLPMSLNSHLSVHFQSKFGIRFIVSSPPLPSSGPLDWRTFAHSSRVAGPIFSESPRIGWIGGIRRSPTVQFRRSGKAVEFTPWLATFKLSPTDPSWLVLLKFAGPFCMGSYGGKPAVLILMLVTLRDKLLDEKFWKNSWATSSIRRSNTFGGYCKCQC